MATSNRGGNRGRGRNNNPDGKNQYSGLAGSAREHPFTAAAAVGGAVAAGVFLWSRRNQISDQIGSLSDQMREWREGLGLTAISGAGDGCRGELRCAARSSWKPPEPVGDFGRGPDSQADRRARIGQRPRI